MTDAATPTSPAALFDVTDKTVVVTGGSRGIGRMIAGGFVVAGADVVIASRKADAVAATVEELSQFGRCSGLAADLSTEDGARTFADAVGADHDRVHVLVNNAGATWGAPLAEHDTASWERVLDLNVQGVFHTTKFFLPLLEAASAPLRRIGRPDDMAGVAIFLASRAGSYLTGAVIPVDGGIATTA